MQNTAEQTNTITKSITKRLDYTPPAFWIDTVDLTFDLDCAKTRVLNKMTMRRNPDIQANALKLQGQEIELARVCINGQGCSFKLENENLIIENLPQTDESFELEIFTTCRPEKNTHLMGLFMSGGNFFTQCEAEGFRRITYFLDRPDIMSKYTVTLRADKTKYPVLLSNGNLIKSGDLEAGRHFATWQDPHKKPCYLFALVAGNLACRQQKIISPTGKEHLLQIYVREKDLDQTSHALNSLINAIAWDEKTYGLPLDLERFMIVATSDFTMGAMENKGLNIFNTRYVLAKTATATDQDFDNVESVVAHEYFHNWTGNRVTCRDWFQLSLKEGLTVFRDQEFSKDMANLRSKNAGAINRIQDVITLKAAQFSEDASPQSHPVRPDQYQEINNFYTATIYEKGAEVVRMMQTLVGKEGFARGMKLYFERHDGFAVTCDDFAKAIADANPQSVLATHLEQFKLWYSQAGTPILTAKSTWNEEKSSISLELSQHTNKTAGQTEKHPLVIPVKIGLIAQDGSQIQSKILLNSHECQYISDNTIALTAEKTTIEFIQLPHEPVLSILQGFSAPVILQSNAKSKALMHQLEHDKDEYNRWDAAQRLATMAAIKAITEENQTGEPKTKPLNQAHISALKTIIKAPLDGAYKALLLTIPAHQELSQALYQKYPETKQDPQKIQKVRDNIQKQIATELAQEWQEILEAGKKKTTDQTPSDRAITNLALKMLLLCQEENKPNMALGGLALNTVTTSPNMTNCIAAIQALLAAKHPLAQNALERFYKKFAGDALVIDKWFSLQALNADTLATIKKLEAHQDFNIKNPNRARSLIFAYCLQNPAGFHQENGEGYEYFAQKVIELDKINPQVAARLARALDTYTRLAEPYQSKANQTLEKLAAHSPKSPDLSEVLERTIKATS